MILELLHRRPDGDVDTYHLKPGRRYHLGRGSGCEVRILDLKLSRKHAAIEFMAETWTLIDLCSTNGCLLNGATMVGTAPLATGATIEIGQTTLVVGALLGRDGAALPSPVPVTSIGHAADFQSPISAETTYPSDEFNPSDQKSLSALHPTAPPPPPIPSLRPPTQRPRQAIVPVTITPEPVEILAPEAIVIDMEATVATLPLPSRLAPPPFVQPKMPTPLSSAPEIIPAAIPVSPANAANSNDRSYFITVLGRRIGPLSRAIARDLKARELKGTLLLTDLAPYPSA